MNPFNPVAVAHRFVKSVLREGDCCVDATVGNGYDTEFLAGLVGRTGKVLGFDLQKQAIENTKSRLAAQGLDQQVTLTNLGHENIGETCETLSWDSLDLVMLNLGYLPGSDKSTVTQSDTTLTCLDSCLGLLSGKGAISIVAYRGHDGGFGEYVTVQNWIRALPAGDFFTLRYERLVTESNTTPVFFWVRRR